MLLSCKHELTIELTRKTCLILAVALVVTAETLDHDLVDHDSTRRLPVAVRLPEHGLGCTCWGGAVLFQAAGAAVGAGMGILGVAGYLGPPILKALVLVGFKV